MWSFVATAIALTLSLSLTWLAIMQSMFDPFSGSSTADSMLSAMSAPRQLGDALLPADKEELLYQSALSTLSCFIAPKCYPRYKCAEGLPAKLQRRKKWEEMSFCTKDLVSRQKQLQRTASDGGVAEKCLVYSFGIERSTEWEEKMAKIFGCEVHAFDPTVDHKDTPFVTFHKLGLQGSGTMKTTNGVEYGAIEPSRLLSLGEIMERLGHVGRMVDVLMMDCEGCEWGVLHQLACRSDGGSKVVGQLLLEAHFQQVLGLATEEDVVMAADAINCLRRDGWGMVTQEKAGCDPRNANVTRGIDQILPHEYFLMYTAMQRLPPRADVRFPRNARVQRQKGFIYDEYPRLEESQ